MSAQPRFTYGEEDTYDGVPWSEADIAELRIQLAGGASIAEAAQVLCRSGTVASVEAKARELGLIK